MGSSSPLGGPLRIFHVEGAALARFAQVCFKGVTLLWGKGCEVFVFRGWAVQSTLSHTCCGCQFIPTYVTVTCASIAPCPVHARLSLPTHATCTHPLQQTNWNYWEAVRRFQRVLVVSGANAQLLARGIRVSPKVFG